MFSDRTNWKLAQNRFTLALEEVRSHVTTLLDLTISNPTRAELENRPRAIKAALPSEQSHDYDPKTKRLLPSRHAVAAYYRSQHGIQPLDVRRIIVPISTSEGYSIVVPLLCNAGYE